MVFLRTVSPPDCRAQANSALQARYQDLLSTAVPNAPRRYNALLFPMRVQSKSVPRRPCSSNQTIFCLCRGAEVALALAGVRGPQQSKLERWIGLFLSLILWLVWNLFMGKVPWVRGYWPKIVGQHSQHWKILSDKILQFVKLLQFRWKCCKSVASGSERWLPTDTSPSVWQQQGLQSISQVLKNTFTIWLFWMVGHF